MSEAPIYTQLLNSDRVTRKLTAVNLSECYYFNGISLKADLHGTILSHATSLRHAYDTF